MSSHFLYNNYPQYAGEIIIVLAAVFMFVVTFLVQVNDGSLILEQLAGIDMLTQEGEDNSVSKTFTFILCTRVYVIIQTTVSVLKC